MSEARHTDAPDKLHLLQGSVQPLVEAFNAGTAGRAAGHRVLALLSPT